MEKKVVVLFDEEKYTDDVILEELRSERFPYYFKLCTSADFVTNPTDYLVNSDEVWVFGNISESPHYRYAVEFGCDIWEMG